MVNPHHDTFSDPFSNPLNMTPARGDVDDFAGFDASSMQSLSYPSGLSSSSSEIAQLRSALGNLLHENERLRIELAQQRRTLFQKQQQIYRLTDHVKRLARVLGQYVSSAGDQPEVDHE